MLESLRIEVGDCEAMQEFAERVATKDLTSGWLPEKELKEKAKRIYHATTFLADCNRDHYIRS